MFPHSEIEGRAEVWSWLRLGEKDLAGVVVDDAEEIAVVLLELDEMALVAGADGEGDLVGTPGFDHLGIFDLGVDLQTGVDLDELGFDLLDGSEGEHDSSVGRSGVGRDRTRIGNRTPSWHHAVSVYQTAPRSRLKRESCSVLAALVDLSMFSISTLARSNSQAKDGTFI